jgi:hypothetical protein
MSAGYRLFRRLLAAHDPYKLNVSYQSLSSCHIAFRIHVATAAFRDEDITLGDD